MGKMSLQQLQAAAILELRSRPQFSGWHMRCWHAVIEMHIENVACPLHSPGIEATFLHYVPDPRPKWFDKKLAIILATVCEHWQSEGIAVSELKNEHYFAEAVRAVDHCLAAWGWAEFEDCWNREFQQHEDRIHRRI